jgi:hypothetical protein
MWQHTFIEEEMELDSTEHKGLYADNVNLLYEHIITINKNMDILLEGSK